MNSYKTWCTSEIAGYVTICTLMVYKPRLVALWILFYPRVTLRVIAVISHDIALVSRAVSFHTQPAELELTIPSFTRWVCMGCKQPNRPWHGVPGPGPRVFCWLPVCCQQPCMQQVEQGLAHSHSRCQSCPGQATVMPVAAGPQRPGLPAKELFNMLYNMTI